MDIKSLFLFLVDLEHTNPRNLLAQDANDGDATAAATTSRDVDHDAAAVIAIASWEPIVTLFVIVYAFYDQGLPGAVGSSRLEAAREEQYLETVKRGYNLYEANCARCHGAQGQGGARAHGCLLGQGRPTKGSLRQTTLLWY